MGNFKQTVQLFLTLCGLLFGGIIFTFFSTALLGFIIHIFTDDIRIMTIFVVMWLFGIAIITVLTISWWFENQT